jgi:hypothetical protein
MSGRWKRVRREEGSIRELKCKILRSERADEKEEGQKSKLKIEEK